MFSKYYPAFQKLLIELEDGRRLSKRVFPDVESTDVMHTFHTYAHDENNCIRAAVRMGCGKDLAQFLADAQVASKCMACIDGEGIVSFVLALLLFENDPQIANVRKAAQALLPEELDIMTSSTDIIPIQNSDIDSVQRALLSFLKGAPIPVCVELLTQAAYGRAEFYGKKCQLLETCHEFILQVQYLIDYNERLQADAVSESHDRPCTTNAPNIAAPSMLASSKKPPRPVSRSPSPKHGCKVDRATSPISEFYELAAKPMLFFSELTPAPPNDFSVSRASAHVGVNDTLPLMLVPMGDEQANSSSSALAAAASDAVGSTPNDEFVDVRVIEAISGAGEPPSANTNDDEFVDVRVIEAISGAGEPPSTNDNEFVDVRVIDASLTDDDDDTVSIEAMAPRRSMQKLKSSSRVVELPWATPTPWQLAASRKGTAPTSRWHSNFTAPEWLVRAQAPSRSDDEATLCEMLKAETLDSETPVQSSDDEEGDGDDAMRRILGV
jgi:hypothetical protein